MIRYFTLCCCFIISLPLMAQDDFYKKMAENNVITSQKIPMPDGDSLSATIVINKNSTTPLPAILMYNIYASEKDALKAVVAANVGYAGIVVNTRGKNKSKSLIEPFVHDADDAWHILEWISHQPWCDGKIGMYGGSYLGFSQWAAAKSMHPALKTIVPQASVAPGIDFPMHNGIYSTYALQWLKYVSAGKLSDRQGVGKYWSPIDGAYFRRGWAYNLIDSLEGKKFDVFSQWVANPSYNAYWQKMTPYKEEFAKINIPVLTITGYYDGDQPGALHYYRQHTKYNPDAEHYLIIGPYDHDGAQSYQGNDVYDYALSVAAKINFNRVVFKWFDYVLKGKEKPEILAGKVNYQVMGTDDWAHAASLQDVAGDALTLYLSDKKLDGNYILANEKPVKEAAILLTIDFKDRTTEFGTRINDSRVVRKSLDSKDGLQFISAPLPEDIRIAGSFSGMLEVTINKRDMDIVLELFELLPDGTYHDLSHYLARASYINDNENRQLLTPGQITKIIFSNTFFTAKKLSKGSRLVFVAGINKNRDWQVNYGTGKDVSTETIADAAEPLQIQWHNSSFIQLPVVNPK